MINVLEYLENTAKKYPKKIAVIDNKESCTYEELLNKSKEIGVCLANETSARKPIAVFMDKSVKTLQIFMGIVYAGCFYTLIDPSFPKERIKQILDILDTSIVITTKKNTEKLMACGYSKKIIVIDNFYNVELRKDIDANKDINITNDINNEKNDKSYRIGYKKTKDRLSNKTYIYNDNKILENIRENMIDTDPLYCNFTSGSTGNPKGVLINHRSVMDFIDNFTDIFGITDKDVIGNQAPFDFDVSVKDIYSCFKTGATLVIIPKSYFVFPNSVVDMLDKYSVTTLIWAVSALVLLERMHSFKYKTPKSINKILFSGEMMPIKHLNKLREYYKEAMFVNLYGPTEITCNCMYHIIDNKKIYELDEKIQLSKSFPNERVFLLSDKDKEITRDMVDKCGEICVAGTSLALGYYNNIEATKKAFVTNPLMKKYKEKIYRTGDLAYWNDEGMLIFAGRKDFQIKHMGHRIELEEIESVLSSVKIVDQGCCFFDEVKNKVVAFYVGKDDKKALISEMRNKVPDYMIPNVFRCVKKIPLNKNGKMDRKLLKKMYREENSK